MSASAGIVAIGAGALGGWAVTYFVMETDFSVIWPNAFAVVLGAFWRMFWPTLHLRCGR